MRKKVIGVVGFCALLAGCCHQAATDAAWLYPKETVARLKALFAKAKAKGVAMEVQAESPFQQHPRYLKFARESGCLLSFGTNNFDDKVPSLDAWFAALDVINPDPSRLLVLLPR